MRGSSPRAWGTLRRYRTRRRASRFIPTGVGNTHLFFGQIIHPRGSSPRAWGTPPSNVINSIVSRFIPTGVGNTKKLMRESLGYTVHPHGRGEHSSRCQYRRELRGSSPRAWGTRSSGESLSMPIRFIPTGVGNTFNVSDTLARSPVHPHGRGEHDFPSMVVTAIHGSSPRAWGTHLFLFYYGYYGRFIPTGVGNT